MSQASTSGSKNSPSLGKADDDTCEISGEFDTTVERNRKKNTSGKKKPKPVCTIRRTWPLDQEKTAQETFPRRDGARATADRAVCLEAMKKYLHASKWLDIRYKIRNMTISDARKLLVISEMITKKHYEL